MKLCNKYRKLYNRFFQYANYLVPILNMDNNSIQQVVKFISENNLKTQEGIVLFDAAVTFYRNGVPVSATSEIQVITLPKEMVLYVMEFVKDAYHESDIYSTSLYHFNYPGKNILEIRDGNYKDLLLFSITAMDKNEMLP